MIFEMILQILWTVRATNNDCPEEKKVENEYKQETNIVLLSYNEKRFTGEHDVGKLRGRTKPREMGWMVCDVDTEELCWIVYDIDIEEVCWMVYDIDTGELCWKVYDIDTEEWCWIVFDVAWRNTNSIDPDHQGPRSAEKHEHPGLYSCLVHYCADSPAVSSPAAG